MAVAGRYLEALGLEANEPTAAYLTEITRRHVAAFAFASIGPRLGLELPIDPESLLDRIVFRHRGGYCFEQNGLLFEVLRELGFDARIQLARVILEHAHPGLTHRVTVVRIDGRRWIVDAGFGPLGPPMPVPLPDDGGGEQQAAFRIVEPEPGEFHLQSASSGNARSLYRFDLVRYGQADCELGHFYSHRHPNAVFVNTLVASRILDDEVRSLRNHEFRVIRPAGDEVTRIGSASQLRDLLIGQFDLRVSSEEAARLFGELPDS